MFQLFFFFIFNERSKQQQQKCKSMIQKIKNRGEMRICECIEFGCKLNI